MSSLSRLGAPLSVAAALVLVAACGSSSAGPPATTPAQVTPIRPSVGSEIPRSQAPQIISLVVQNGDVNGDIGTVAVRLNSAVRLTVVADVADVVRVQGYGVDQRTSPTRPIQIDFVASKAGTFPVRLVQHNLLLTRLHVS